MCPISHVRCHISLVTRHVSHLRCHMSHIFSSYFLLESGGVSVWRVCYQWGLPHLVFRLFDFFLSVEKSRRKIWHALRQNCMWTFSQECMETRFLLSLCLLVNGYCLHCTIYITPLICTLSTLLLPQPISSLLHKTLHSYPQPFTSPKKNTTLHFYLQTTKH